MVTYFNPHRQFGLEGYTTTYIYGFLACNGFFLVGRSCIFVTSHPRHDRLYYIFHAIVNCQYDFLL